MTTTHEPRLAPPVLDGFEVLDACHRQTLVVLGQLDALLQRLGAGGADAQARDLASDVVNFFATTAREHHEDEERHLFPKMAQSSDPELVQAVLRLRQDHGWLEEDWRELEPMLKAVADGQSWVDTETLRASIAVFAALSRDHITLEESFIYPQARLQLRATERSEMGREMAARRRGERRTK